MKTDCISFAKVESIRMSLGFFFLLTFESIPEYLEVTLRNSKTNQIYKYIGKKANIYSMLE